MQVRVPAAEQELGHAASRDSCGMRMLDAFVTRNPPLEERGTEESVDESSVDGYDARRPPPPRAAAAGTGPGASPLGQRSGLPRTKSEEAVAEVESVAAAAASAAARGGGGRLASYPRHSPRVGHCVEPL
jgi:hypothetical protein